MRLNSFGFSVSLNFSGDRLTSGDKSQQASSPGAPASAYQEAAKTYRGIYETEEADFSIPWNISLNYNYSLSKYNPFSLTKYSNVSGNINFNLTPTWKFILSGNYDIDNKRFAAPQVAVSKDLHCWLMNFTWNPLGTYTGYRLRSELKPRNCRI